MRDTRIDFLRFVGLIMIIFAHVNPPALLFQLRNFDVPLMVLISGISFRLSVKNEPYIKYLWSRIQRLVFPVWIFLTFYFVLQFIVSGPFESEYLTTIIRTYLLIDGIGYVWIIRVFVLVAIIAPLIYSIHKRISSNFIFVLVLLFLYSIYEFVVFSMRASELGVLGVILKSFIFYTISYGLVFALGIRLPDFNKRDVVICLFIITLVFFTLFIINWNHNSGWLPTQEFKYPPTSYYLSFALMMAFVLYLASERIMAFCQQVRLESLILFIGSNSIWIYLWHILYLQVFKSLDGFVSWYLSVLLCSILTTYLQVQLVQRLLEGVTDKAKKKLVRTLFTG